MKKLFALAVAAAVSLSACLTASAQFNYGVIGGVTFSSAKPSEWKLTQDIQYHVGLTCRVQLPLGFAIQPELMYHSKGSNLADAAESDAKFDYQAGFIELPVSVQWGPDLLVMRPYFEVVPFVGYALNNRYRYGDEKFKNDWTGLQRWEYGVGVGAGVEIWHFQISARYNWNLGSMFDAKQEITDAGALVNKLKDSVGNKGNFGGVTLSLAVLF
ncbi:MAG: porin family protein [Candidatus Cryptobacteroides sp.]